MKLSLLLLPVLLPFTLALRIPLLSEEAQLALVRSEATPYGDVVVACSFCGGLSKSRRVARCGLLQSDKC